VLVVGTLAAYSLHRFRWPAWLSAGFLAWTLIFHMIPVMTLIGPWYVAFRELGLYDTRTALVLTHVTINLPMTVWLMRAFFREIPPEIEEAALVDGCRPLEAFRRVTLPLVVPGLIAAGILAFIFSWNEFPVALSLTSRDLATVPGRHRAVRAAIRDPARADGRRLHHLDHPRGAAHGAGAAVHRAWFDARSREVGKDP
jgi:multiple sugar transport system permease protein